jgi:deferrochelatase/peroxidase EfeB
MSDFFETLEYDKAIEIDQLSSLAFELRENRTAVLKSYGAEDEAALLQQIQTGLVDEHPAYEHYLAARILAATRETVRSMVGERLRKAQQT